MPIGPNLYVKPFRAVRILNSIWSLKSETALSTAQHTGLVVSHYCLGKRSLSLVQASCYRISVKCTVVQQNATYDAGTQSRIE